jgi:heterodisulfide reductase subunit B
MTSKKQVAAELTGAILAAARGADCMVTICPMCQMNQDGYQAYISRLRHEDVRITILYLPQLIGLALGLAPEKLSLDLNLALTDAFRAKVGM